MGVEARFQAMPENCDLFITARHDREIAESIQFFQRLAFHYRTPHPMWDAKWLEAYGMAQKLGAEKPNLVHRYFYAGSRTFDAIVYLLSPARRNLNFQQDNSLIHQAIYGQEFLHPEAHSTQGRPIGLIPSSSVPDIATYLGQVSLNMLHEHYHADHIEAAGVYKMSLADEQRFKNICDEFVGMRDLYQAAAEHNEAVIVIID